MSIVVNVVSQDGSWTAFDGRGRNSASGTVVTGIKRDNAFASYTIDSENNMSCFIPDEQYPFKTIVLSTGEHG